MPELTLVIRGGTVVGPAGLTRSDVAVAGTEIVAVAESIDAPQGARVLDASGCLVGPGLVDLHTHLRQPGREEAETIETGARAAALGGFTAIVAMPNTEPAIDTAGVAAEVLALGVGCSAEVAVAGAITVGRAGHDLAPLGELAALGVTFFTDDGAGVQDGALMRRALDYAKGLGVTLAQHCEDNCLAAGGAMHEGSWSSRLGIPGIPAAAEEAMVARDIALARLTGAPVHFLHMSTAGSVALIRRCGRTRTWLPSWPACATAPSTRWPPITRRTRPSRRTARSIRPPRACWGCRRRCPSRGRSSRRTWAPSASSRC